MCCAATDALDNWAHLAQAELREKAGEWEAGGPPMQNWMEKTPVSLERLSTGAPIFLTITRVLASKPCNGKTLGSFQVKANN